MKKITDNIFKIRISKGFSHEYMAERLQITQPAYSNIEKNRTKLTIDRIYKIAEILETSIEDILDLKTSALCNQSELMIDVNALPEREIQNLSNENKEVYVKLISAKDEQIALLKSMLNK